MNTLGFSGMTHFESATWALQNTEESTTAAKITDNFNGADLRNVCTEAGMFAIRSQREYVLQEDFMKAARKIKETKHLESKMDYSKV